MDNNIKDMLAQLALADAVGKAVGDMTSTRKNDNLRAHADAALAELYETTGASKMQVEVNGQEVGTFSIAFTKPIDAVDMEVYDTGAFARWLHDTDEGLDTLMGAISSTPVSSAVKSAAQAYGFLPDGCRMVKVCEPKRPKGSTLRVDKLKVAQAMGKQLPGAVAGLLGGEVE